MIAQLESQTFVVPDRIVIRPLTAADSHAYRRLRQHILDIGDGRVFSSSYTREQQLTSEQQWREWCTETPTRCTIGSFVNDKLVGITCILVCGDPRNLTVEWYSTWMDPQYRRSGLAKQAREKVREWSYAHGYRYAITDIRADNTLFREVREKEGAMYLFTQRDVTWADGSTADTNFFMLNLSPGAERSRSAGQAAALLEAALAFLKHDDAHH
jgi:GNAT superfamily N-acetyltransferase